MRAYEAAVTTTWYGGHTLAKQGAALHQELVRYAILAPSSHNTQCWKFALEDQAITILPDLLRRCPAVDPDDHHVFVSLGCAAENLNQAALAHGLKADVGFDNAQEAVRIALAPTSEEITSLFNAIPARQCTRGDYDGKPLSNEELRLLERAGTSKAVRMLVLTEQVAMERVLDYVVQANTAQMADSAFVKELKTWIRFNAPDAVRTRDGLFSVASGNPAIPTWLGNVEVGLVRPQFAAGLTRGISLMLRAGSPRCIDWRVATQAGIAYTLGVFIIAFAVGTIRVTLIAPRFGSLLAVLLEAPIILAVSWRVSRWCNRRFSVNREPRTRAMMGAVAFTVLMMLELGVSVLIFGETFGHYFAKYALPPGFIGLAMQVCFAFIPWIQCHVRET